MKKIIAILLAALAVLGAAFAASSESAADAPVLMEGFVTEITADGYLVDTEAHGEVMVLVGEETYVEATAEIAAGDYLYIDYDGKMTRSLPPQVSASVVRMHRIEGSVMEYDAEANTVMLDSETHGEVLVALPEEWAGQEFTAEALTVYFDGVMTMSLPPQIGAGYVIPGYAMQGTVTEIADGYVMLGEGMESIQVNVAPELLPEDMKTGDVIRVVYNGQMTRSIPAQIVAAEIIQISR